MVDLNGSTTAVVNGGIAPSENLKTQWPFVALASAGGTAKLELAPDIFLTFEGSAWLGYNTQTPERSAADQTTVLRGLLNRYAYFSSRSPLSPKENVFGINELSGTLSFDAIGLSLKLAAFSQVEKLAYTYAHNYSYISSTSPGFPSLQTACLDSNTCADLYGPYIGPVAALIFRPTFAPGLEILGQIGTAGGPQGEGVAGAMKGAFDLNTLYETVQAKYATTFDNGNSLTGVVYFQNKDPLERKTATGETVSPAWGMGFGLMFNVPDIVAIDVGYSFNKTKREGQGLTIDSQFHGVNVSADFPIADSFHLIAGYSYLGFNEKTDAFIKSTEKTGDHAIELAAVVPLIPDKLGLTLGGGAILIDQKNNLDPVGGNRYFITAGLTGNLMGSSN